MDRRNWPWRKKTSEKVVTTTDSSPSTLSNLGVKKPGQDNAKNVNYVQISLDSYKHLTELEDQVKILHDNLSAAQAEMATKDNLVKQHAKVAEEAVSGWEKAEAETSALKHQLELVTLSKLKAEECATHLDGALKECMKQVRDVREEGEQKFHDVVFAKTKQWAKIKSELEEKLVYFEHELLRASAENAAITKSLQESSNILMKISDGKAQAEAEIEILKGNIQSYEKEINSLKYELHIVTKELEIRNEEKNMSIRSADVANKQHQEDVKKISKLDAECQRLRILVRKKLPGPAALAQMKLEVESLGHDQGESRETRLRQSPVKNCSPHHLPPTSAPGFDSESIQHLQKENEFLTARLLSVEEEMKMLKEALSKRNSELQTSRDMHAKLENKLRSMEARIQTLNQQIYPTKSNMDLDLDATLSQNERNPPSLTSMSEHGTDEYGSCSESWATSLISEPSQFKEEKGGETCNRIGNSNNLELMDDFLEMEKLACSSMDSNGTVTSSNSIIDKIKIENAADVQNNDANKEQVTLDKPGSLFCPGKKQFDTKASTGKIDSPMGRLQMRIACFLESENQETDMGKVLNSLRLLLQEMQEQMTQHSVSHIIEEAHSVSSFNDTKHHEMTKSKVSGFSSKQFNNSATNSIHDLDPEFKNAISHIHDIIMTFAKEVENQPSSDYRLKQKMDQFSSCVKDVLQDKRSISDFILGLCKILSEASEMRINLFNNESNEDNISDCVDKVTLLENKVAQHQPGKENFMGVSTTSHSFTHPEAEGSLGNKYEANIITLRFSLEEFEQLKLEKESLQMELVTCTELLEQTKTQLLETEQKLIEVESRLTAGQKSNSLSETQLKCMAESYELLETRTQELQAEVNELQRKAQTLNYELEEEKRARQNDLAIYREIQDQIKRNEKRSICSGVDTEGMKKQEEEIAAAAEKLAECQETILLLSRQLQALHPPEEESDYNRKNKHLVKNDLLEDEPGSSGSYTQGAYASINLGKSEMKSVGSLITPTGGNFPLDDYCCPSMESPISFKFQKHHISKTPSSMSSTSALPEKYGHSVSRFFSK
ncbi:filament-like plant protein 4 isoform X1 [Canna indica]|uniref:Filament-like plant protein 4 isoform X1 n=1 Tax=Canna indica TaxID=4628 RepID=A0AAQ3L3B6_9LILI|nr:filament-like plant protein 4 isoform X1 [Canna indica]